MVFIEGSKDVHCFSATVKSYEKICAHKQYYRPARKGIGIDALLRILPSRWVGGRTTHHMKTSRHFDDDFLAGLSPTRKTLFDYAVKLAELRDTASIRDCLFKLIFSITSADRAAVFVDHSLWELERGDLQPQAGKPNEAIDRVVATGEAAFSDEARHSTLCLPLVAGGRLIGAMY